VQCAIEAGRIEPKNEAMKTFWTAAITADPSAADVLASMPSKTTLGAVTLAAQTQTIKPLTGRERTKAALAAEATR
jgi:hypothetical protein